MTNKKPWLNAEEQVEHLKSKGTRFALMSECDAISYLKKNNNYFRLRSYRTGFSKVEEGPRIGQYANLDFKMLVDLSIVDMLIRQEMLLLTLDIEHFEKVLLLNKIEEAEEDGYEIVADFLATYDEKDKHGNIRNRTKEEISQGKSNAYTIGLLEKYPDFDFPAWAFVEVISFGTFNYFYKFCADRFDSRSMLDEFYLLQNAKSLRNACAHNHCILNDMSACKKPKHKARFAVSDAVGQIDGIGAGQRKSKLSNERIQQIVTTLYLHSKVASDGVLEHRAISLDTFSRRMNKHVNYYSGNYQITSCFSFLTSVINAWFPSADSADSTDSENSQVEKVENAEKTDGQKFH